MIYVDMDGVLADFHTASFEIFGHDYWGEYDDRGAQMDYNIWKELHLTENQFWQPIRTMGAKFWEHLPVCPWFNDLISAIQATEQRWMVLTSTRQCPWAASGKIKWLENYFNPMPDFFLTQSQNKQLLAKPGDVLIDDCDRNCIEFEHAGGCSITFPRPWNRMYKRAGGSGDNEISWVKNRLNDLCVGA